MSRNRFTTVIRKSERDRITGQEKELEAVARELRCKSSESTVTPFTDGAKEHRRVRLEQNRRHKPVRSGAVETTQP